MKGKFICLAAIASALFLAACGTTDITSSEASTLGVAGPRFALQGFPVTQPVPSAEVIASSASAAARVGNAPIAAPGALPTLPRAIPRLHGPRPIELPSLFDPSPSADVDTSGFQRFTAGPMPLAAASPPRAPALSASFVGLVDDGTRIPPDTMGAAGPNHLVSFLNTEVGFFSKTTGGRLNPGVSLFGFWSPLISANLLPNDLFDPKVIYDASSGRFIAVTLDGSLPADNSSWVLLAVSKTTDPTAGWSTWALPADNTSVTWADFPGLGVDDNNVYITVNLFDNAANPNFHNSKVFSVPKTQLLSLPQTTALSWTEFTDPGFTLQPAHSLGTATSEYFVTESGIVIGSRRFLEILAVTGTPPTLVSLGTVEVSPYPVIPVSLPVAPQTQIDTGDTRILNVVYRNGRIYATHTVSDSTNTKTEVAWYEIVPSPSPTLAQQGRISDPTRWYYYPSIGVNQDNVAAIGFSGSSSREYVGGYYTIVRPSSGVAEAVSLMKTGEAPYYKTLSGTDNRWGDFSATVVDPTDNVTFWTLQEYAQTPDPVTGASRWGTWWGTFHPSDVAAPSGLSATAGTGVQVTLTWADSSVNESGFKIERRLLPAGGYSIIATTGPNTISFVDNTDTGLAAGANYFYRVESFNAGGGAYSNEAYATTTPIAPVAAGGGGGGGCLSITRSGGEVPIASSLFSVGILLLPACALGLRRFFRRQERTVPIRHPLC
ncbi:MAG: fibronectin type III domain-containing protein [Deltaproteobacteria bacterium]|nr:fibronectin type III domain-containing protein [Deltaproteobacteria bacterium]